VACADQQVCVAHLLREIASVHERENSPEWDAFSRTLKRRGHEPLDTIVDALKTYVRKGQLPRMPAFGFQVTSDDQRPTDAPRSATKVVAVAALVVRACFSPTQGGEAA